MAEVEMPGDISIESRKWAVAAIFLVDGVGFGGWAAHVPVFQQLLHIPNGSLTFALVSLIIGAIISMPLTGQLVERFGSRRIIRIATVSYLVTIALLAQAHSFLFLIIAAGLFGAAKGTLDVSVNAQAVTVEKQYHRPVMSFFQGCWSLGGLIGAGASGLLLQHGGSAQRNLSVLAVMLLLPSLWAMPLLAPEEKNLAADRRSRGQFIWPDAQLLRLSILAFFGLMAEGEIGDWASVYLHSNVGVTLSRAAAGYSVYAIAMATGRFTGDWLAQRLSSRSILHASGLLVVFGMGCMLLFPSWISAVVGLMLTGLGIANVVPVVWGAAGRNTRMGAGPAISTVTTIGFCGFLTGPPVIGSLATWIGLRAAMVIIPLAGLVVAVGPALFSLAPSPGNTLDQQLIDRAV